MELQDLRFVELKRLPVTVVSKPAGMPPEADGRTKSVFCAFRRMWRSCRAKASPTGCNGVAVVLALELMRLSPEDLSRAN